MITVTVRTIGQLRLALGSGEIRVTIAPDSRIDDLLSNVARRSVDVHQHIAAMDDKVVPPPLRVLVNGRDIGVLAGRDTVLQEGDDVLLLTPLAGG